MKSVGIVVEYNPFHNGHKHHLEMARKVSNADIVVGVMSGDYVQRGEPAAFNRWERAEIALKNGVDIIAELPIFYSTQNAELFAKGALETLAELGVKDIVFGSETANLEKLEKIVSLIKERANFVSEFWDLSDFFFVAPTSYDEKARKNWKEETPALMQELISVISEIQDFTSVNIETIIKDWMTKNEIGMGKVMP